MTPVILGAVAAGMFLIGKLDQKMEIPGRMKCVVLAAALAGSGILRRVFGAGQTPARILLAVVIGCLLLGCVTDLMICQVHNFVWWFGAAAAAALLWPRLWDADGRGGMWLLLELTAFWLIQLGPFSRLYGKADCYAFCVCAAAQAGLGLGLEWMTLHMALAFSLLALVQCIGKNVTAEGRLRKPVPFVPYLTAGFYLLLIFMKICGETVVPPS